MDARQLKLVELARNNDIRAAILRNGYKDTETIAQCLKIDRTTAKQHLTILKRCGLVTYRNTDLVNQGVSKNAIR